ncbi:MAG: hypothetical protein DRP09_10900 [Candidatus Thorarchaeota archaeon]|nr:MAG: hypothetical protein DRP09_10900 [Candidatus Thorarchaeota archaeon]
MGLITRPNTYTAGNTIDPDENTGNETTLYTLVNGNIDNDNINASAAIAYSKLNLSLSVTDTDVSNTADIKLGAIEIVIDGAGGAIQTGIKGDLEIPFNCSIVSATALADQTGDIVVDVWSDTYANYPATNADSITAAAPITISSAAKSQDTTLSGWTVAITAGDVLRFNVDSAATITRCTISLKIRKT